MLCTTSTIKIRHCPFKFQLTPFNLTVLFRVHFKALSVPKKTKDNYDFFLMFQTVLSKRNFFR